MGEEVKIEVHRKLCHRYLGTSRCPKLPGRQRCRGRVKEPRIGLAYKVGHMSNDNYITNFTRRTLSGLKRTTRIDINQSIKLLTIKSP